MLKTNFLRVSFITLFLFGCGKNEVVSAQANTTPNNSSSSSSLPDVPPDMNPAPAGGSGQSVSTPIKSDIDFSAIVWPTTMSLEDRKALELALNISGSFEGNESWINITNNSDNMGMSLGLLSQNFGSNTLQPLLVAMKTKHPDVMARIFSQSHLASLYAMLTDWQTANPSALIPSERVSPLDDDGEEFLRSRVVGVSWAQSTLYSGSAFIPQWKSEFQTLAVTPEYINLQFGQALAMHAQAKAYAAIVGVNQIRSYLMMFDIVDQDGNIAAGDFSDYAVYVKANPSASADARLQEILALRMRHVSSTYSNDVKSRKVAIINGQGLVHGVQRNLETQYQFSRTETY